MALTQEEITYLSQPDRITLTNLSDEAKDFRDRYLRGVYKRRRLEIQHARRKAEDAGVELIDYTFKDWKSEEEYREWIEVDRLQRAELLTSILSDDDWLEKLAKKYYGDNWMVVYADISNHTNWARQELPDKKKFKKNEED